MKKAPAGRWPTVALAIPIMLLTLSVPGQAPSLSPIATNQPSAAPGQTLTNQAPYPERNALPFAPSTTLAPNPATTRTSNPNPNWIRITPGTTIATPLHNPQGSAPTIAGCPIFPADNIWNTDISALPVNQYSAAWISNSGGPSQLLHPDFGPSGTSIPYGIPYIVVDSSHPKISLQFDYASESDPGPYPFGSDTPIEGGAGSGGDQHAIMLDSSNCTLYELYNANYSASGSTAGSGAIWSLTSDALRPAGWTSADAAGLPILPGLLRPDEVESGVVNHAIRMTVATTDTSNIWPARHEAGSVSDANFPPMGARFRLKANFDISHFRPDTQVVLTAMKHYGTIVADNGSNWYFQGAADSNWDTAMLDELKTIPAGEFEAVDTSSLMMDPNSGVAR